MNKKYISLGLLGGTALLWLIAPIIEFIVSITSLDLLDMPGAGLPDYLVAFVPLVAIVLGVVGAFAKPALVKIAGLVGGIGYIAAVVLQMIAAEFELSLFGWGLWGILVLLVANMVISLKAE